MRILGVLPLYLVYKGLTTGVGSLLPPVPEPPEDDRKREEQRKEDEKAIEKQREEDEAKRVEEEKKAKAEQEARDTEYERKRKADWLTFDAVIRASPPDCKYGFREKLIVGSYLSGIHSYWICEKKTGIGF